MRQEDIEALASVSVLMAALKAWRVFKRTHDLAKVEVCCCEKTRALFDSLDELEKEILRGFDD